MIRKKENEKDELFHEAGQTDALVEGQIQNAPLLQPKMQPGTNGSSDGLQTGLEKLSDVDLNDIKTKRASGSQAIQAKFNIGGTIVSTPAEVEADEGAKKTYGTLGALTKAAFDTLLKEDPTYTLWDARARAYNYAKVSKAEAEVKLKAELNTWNGLVEKPKCFNTGYNGRGNPNAVVTPADCDSLIAGWAALVKGELGDGKDTRSPWSGTDGVLTGKRMNDFLIDENDKPVFNFHIEVERGNPT